MAFEHLLGLIVVGVLVVTGIVDYVLWKMEKKDD